MRRYLLLLLLLIPALLLAQDPADFIEVGDRQTEDLLTALSGLLINAMVYASYRIPWLAKVKMDGASRMMASGVIVTVLMAVLQNMELWESLVALLKNPLVISLAVYLGVLKKAVGSSKAVFQPDPAPVEVVDANKSDEDHDQGANY